MQMYRCPMVMKEGGFKTIIQLGLDQILPTSPNQQAPLPAVSSSAVLTSSRQALSLSSQPNV